MPLDWPLAAHGLRAGLEGADIDCAVGWATDCGDDRQQSGDRRGITMLLRQLRDRTFSPLSAVGDLLPQVAAHGLVVQREVGLDSNVCRTRPTFCAYNLIALTELAT